MDSLYVAIENVNTPILLAVLAAGLALVAIGLAVIAITILKDKEGGC